MTRFAPALVLCLSLLASTESAAQAPPELTRQQRDTLKALVTAVDASTVDTADNAQKWQTHVLRTSDGAHYVAFSLEPPPASLPDRPMVIYVRLASVLDPRTATAERSAVRDWLQGSRVDPRMLPQRGGLAIGEMPPMGAGAIGVRGGSSVGSSDLQLLELERERTRQRKEEDERRRRAELEGTREGTAGLLPFEDFDVGRPSTFGDGARIIQRALTAGPGRYRLFVAWADPSAKPGPGSVHVARQELQLGPSIQSEFTLSSVIVADQVGIREVPYTSLQQRAHPYSIGATEIAPAHDSVLRPDERLAAAFQIINPSAAADGKPSVVVNLRVTRMDGVREQQVAQLTPLTYDASTLPADFDARLGHPIIAAMSVPLATLTRGSYRLNIAAEDKVSGMVARGGCEFTIIGTPASFLAEAPAYRPAFDRSTVLDPTILTGVLDALVPPPPSPAPSATLSRALTVARSGRLAELLAEEPVPAAEAGVRAALTGLALLSIGDSSAARQFQRAAELNAAAPAVLFLLGAAWAQQSRELEAVNAWQTARAAGGAPKPTLPLMIEACLRRGDYARALSLADEAQSAPPDSSVVRAKAAAYLATRRDAEAVAGLEKHLAGEPADPQGQWLLVHALYAQIVHGGTTDRARFVERARAYIDANGANAALVAEWLKTIS